MPAAAAKQSKQASFAYECTNQQGSKVTGEISASSIAMAKAELRKQGLNPIVVKKKSSFNIVFERKKKVTASDIAQFSRHMATMMMAGIPLVQAFDIVGKGVENSTLKNLIFNIKSDVEAGRSFSEALRQHPLQFDSLFCSLVSAGEASGALDTMLDRIATYKEKTETLKRKIKKALFYPMAVLVVAIIVSAILLIFVVPQFEKLFKGFGADLPMFTQMVINLSGLVQRWWWAILALALGAGWGFDYARKRYVSVQQALDRFQLRLPIIGSILKKAAIARFARTLSTTFAAGVPLVEALDTVAGASGNYIFSNAILRIREEVATGAQVQSAMRNTGIFPNMVVQMVAIGEESGALDAMLGKVASIFEEEVDAAVDGLSSLLEPLIMAILGVLVGSLVIAMYLPIFKMGSVI